MTREELIKARVKNDSKRLIEKAMRKDPPELDRNVKAWLKPSGELPEIDRREEKYKNALD